MVALEVVVGTEVDSGGDEGTYMVPCRVLSRALVELHIARGAKVHPVYMARARLLCTAGIWREVEQLCSPIEKSCNPIDNGFKPIS